MSGTLTQAPNRSTAHRAAVIRTSSTNQLAHVPLAPRATPNILRAATAALGVLAVIAAVVLTSAAAGARSEISTVGGTDAPSVRATDDFLFRLQDMDAQLVNALLVNGDTQVHVPRSTSEQLYETDRKAADGDLQNATVALAGNQTALDQLHAVSDGFGQYQAQAARTLADDEREGGTTAGTAPASEFIDYQVGHNLLFGSDDRGGLMKAATDLEQASKDAIGTSASSADRSLNFLIVQYVGFGVLLVGGLVVLQVYVFRRFKRMVNPALAGATMAALVLLIGGAAGTAVAASDFHTAKSDAFDSVLALSEANATSAGINADESRWLLAHDNPVQRGEYEQSFFQGENEIANVPGGSDIPGYAGVVDQEAQIRTVDTLSQTAMTPNSSFGEEFHNVTFSGEDSAALKAFYAYNTYIQDDGKLRTMPLDTAAGLKAAIDFDTNADTAGSSDRAFNDYTKMLADLININESHFESSMPAAENGIGTWTWLPYVLAVLLIGLTVLGLRPRLTEYR